MGRYNSEPVSEAEIAQGVWRILAKLKATSGGPVELSVDERSLRLAAGCTLKSEIHTDAYVISVLARASDLLVKLKHLQFLSSHVQLEPVVVIPFVQAVKDYYDPLRMQFDHYAQEEMGLSLLEQKVVQHFRSVRCIMLFFGALFDDPDGDNPIANAVFQSEKNQYHLSDLAIESTWTRFTHLYFLHQENVEHVLPIWHSLSQHLLEVIPAYLDTISEYESIEASHVTDDLILAKYGESGGIIDEYRIFLRRLWSDKLVSLMTRAFLDQQRLSEHVDKIELTPWSQYFAAALAAKGNCDKQITPTLLTELMEQSCLDYGVQFSQKILEKMKANKQLERRLHELQALFDLRAFAAAYANCSLDDEKNNDENARFIELKKVLKSPLLPPNMEKYWALVPSDASTNRFYRFKIAFKQKGTWPLNLILSDEFMDDICRFMDLWSRLSYHKIMLNILVVAGMVYSDDGKAMPFDRRTQHFIAALRQVLQRLTEIVQKKINKYVQVFVERVTTFDSFNDLERYVHEWRQSLDAFFDEEYLPYKTLIEMCDLADDLHELFRLLVEQQIADQWTFLHELRTLFVQQCDQLSSTRKDFAEQKTFEAELSDAVRPIHLNMFR